MKDIKEKIRPIIIFILLMGFAVYVMTYDRKHGLTDEQYEWGQKKFKEKRENR